MAVWGFRCPVFKAGAVVLPAYVKLQLYWIITESEKWKRELLEDEVEGADLTILYDTFEIKFNKFQF